eukprot:m.79092 g.79092  ORF g.79092 m.79092 type:complete len:337 (-) comp7994_c0_seq1:3862-4872(-)
MRLLAGPWAVASEVGHGGPLGRDHQEVAVHRPAEALLVQLWGDDGRHGPEDACGGREGSRRAAQDAGRLDVHLQALVPRERADVVDDAHHKLLLLLVDANEQRVVHDVQPCQEVRIVKNRTLQHDLAVVLEVERVLGQGFHEVFVHQHVVLAGDLRVPAAHRALQVEDARDGPSVEEILHDDDILTHRLTGRRVLEADAEDACNLCKRGRGGALLALARVPQVVRDERQHRRGLGSRHLLHDEALVGHLAEMRPGLAAIDVPADAVGKRGDEAILFVVVRVCRHHRAPQLPKLRRKEYLAVEVRIAVGELVLEVRAGGARISRLGRLLTKVVKVLC